MHSGPHDVTGTGPLDFADTARPATWSMGIWSAQRAAHGSWGLACWVQEGEQPIHVEGRQVGVKGRPSLILELSAGARLPSQIHLLPEWG